jgi:hypothetical protein
LEWDLVFKWVWKNYNNGCFWDSLQGGYSAAQTMITYRVCLLGCNAMQSAENQHTIWHYIPEGRTLYNHHCENLKS